MDTINTNQIEIGGKLLNIEPKKLNGNVQINLTGDVSGSIDTPIEAGKTITIETRVEGGTGGGIPEAPIDDKQYARKNAGWVEVEGGGGASAFKAIYGTTSYAEVLAAINADSIVICDVSGYIYQYVNKDSTKIVFALTEKNSSGNVMNETVWVNSDDTWDGEAIRVAKHSEVPTLTSQLTNDAGFSKVVVGNAPPAAGTPDDTITLILGGAGGAGEYGAWEEIGSADLPRNAPSGTQIPLSKSFDNFDFILFETLWSGSSNNITYTQIQSVDNIKAHYSDAKPNRFAFNSGTLTLGSDNVNNLYCHSDSYGYTISVKVYGINLRGRKDEYALRKVDKIWNRGTNYIDTNLAILANHKIIIKAYAHFISGTACTLLASTSTSWQSSSTHYLSLCTWGGKFWFNGNTSEGELVFGSVSEGDLVTIILNDENSRVTLNGTDVGASKSIQEVGNYRINRRNDSPYQGNFESIQVIDKTTNEEVMFVHSYEVQGPDGATFKKVILDDHNHFTPIVV